MARQVFNTHVNQNHDQVAVVEKFNQFISDNHDFGRFSELHDFNEYALHGYDRYAIRRVLQHVLSTDLRVSLGKFFSDKLASFVSQREIEIVSQKVMSKPVYDSGHRMVNNSELTPLNVKDVSESRGIVRWMHSMQQSDILSISLRNDLEDLDVQVYETCLNGSLVDRDGLVTDNLINYPTPETIRNIVLLAAADHSNYRTVHANWFLSVFAKQKDVGSILDESEKKYPELRRVRKLLTSWKLTEHYNHPDIRKAASELSSRVFHEPTNQPDLTEIARQALDNPALLRLLAKQRLIRPNEVKTLVTAQRRLKVLEKKDFKMEQRSWISESSLNLAIRTNAQAILEQTNSPDPENVKNLKLISLLCREINKTSDISMLKVLSSDYFITAVVNSSLERNEAKMFLDALAKITSHEQGLLDGDLDLILGKGLIHEGNIGNATVTLIGKWVSRTLENGGPLEEGTALDSFKRENWKEILAAYVIWKTNNAGKVEMYFSESTRTLLSDAFKDEQLKDFCLEGLKLLWLDYLTKGTSGEMPYSLLMVPKVVNFCNSAGPLSQIDALSQLIFSVDNLNKKPTTVENSKLEIFKGLSAMEQRFIREKWSNQDRSEFYNISKDIINVSPSLYTEFVSLFDKFSSAQMRNFSEELFPLYRAKLALIEKTDEKTGNRTFNTRDLVGLRKNLRELSEGLVASDKAFIEHKEKLLEEMRSVFQDRFGIIKITDDFTMEHTRSFVNISLYLANIHQRSTEKTNILGYYLALRLNGRWDNYRRGEIIDPSEYLTSEKAHEVNNVVTQRSRVNPLTSEALGISGEAMEDFNQILQSEVSNLTIGVIETVDVKLNNVIINLGGLTDPDLYPDVLDRQRMQLLSEFGSKKVGSVVARIYQELANNTQVIFSEDELIIKKQIEEIISTNNLGWTQSTLKTLFQDGMKPLATVSSVLQFVENANASALIDELRKNLQPDREVIEIFGKLGEDFYPGSGVLAISHDLNYLDSLVVKREDELTENEREVIKGYVAKIRERLVGLQTIFDQVKGKFESMQKSIGEVKNPLLKDKLEQISGIINTQSSEQAITSTMTNDLNVIIENIRECLSCTRDGSNNDTNLTFGDQNKFYLYSHLGTGEKGSLSDQVVFLEPITLADGTKEISFVLDRIYGTNTPLILNNQASVVIKKYKAIKQKFPGIKMSIFVSDASLLSSGLSQELFLENMSENGMDSKKETDVEVEVVQSSAGDHYIEFGGGSRESGKRTVSGVIVR